MGNHSYDGEKGNYDPNLYSMCSSKVDSKYSEDRMNYSHN